MAYTVETVIPCRGRVGGPDTSALEYLDRKELDAAAPLAPEHSKNLGEYDDPSPETLKMLERRIRAAHQLKYGAKE